MARPKGGKSASGKSGTKRVKALVHDADKRRNIPTAETQSYLADDERAPKPKLYKRNPDLDPQLVWKGKDEQDSEPLRVDTVPVYIQEKIQPRQIVEDLRRLKNKIEPQADLFSDFNGLHDPEAKLDFYAHDQNWTNRMILGDGLLVMNSLAEKEKLKGRVQTIYIDPPYGIKFGSNWQASTKQRDVKDGKAEDTSREPEVIKAFRDTWALGIHSYLSYLRDRLVVARELLTDSGSIFVQIGDENVHLVRSLLDEVFGSANFCAEIAFAKTTGQTDRLLASTFDFLIWYAKEKSSVKNRTLFDPRPPFENPTERYVCVETEEQKIIDLTIGQKIGREPIPKGRILKLVDPTSQTGSDTTRTPFEFRNRSFSPVGGRGWSTNIVGMRRVEKAEYYHVQGNRLWWKSYRDVFPYRAKSSQWLDTRPNAFGDERYYVVQTATQVVESAILMTTDPGDLVLDPTCGSGTTAYVAEQWGRRWITIDTSRVALALARTRLMAARFPYYLLADSPEGQCKEAELTGRAPAERATAGDIRKGFVYERVPHVTLKSIANNAEIDVIHEKWHRILEPLRADLNMALGKTWEEWEIPREADKDWAKKATELLAAWWESRRARQTEIDASIARAADVETLYDRPYEDKGTVRVTGPFTVESLSPHRVLPTDAEDEAILDALEDEARERGEDPPPRPKRRPSKTATGGDDFLRVVLENLKSAGVQNTKKKERLTFSGLKPWAGGKYIHAEARYEENGKERRAAITVGPEYGTVSYQLVREAAREAKDLFDVLVVCGFAFEPHVGDETMSLGRLVVLKARMNQDLHMAEHLKKTGAGNLFVVFGEPDVKLDRLKDGSCVVEIKGVDVFDPTTGAVKSGGVDDIACWFIDTDYDEESFFVRHAYFLGGKDPYEKLKRTLKAEIDESAWATLYSAKSRPFPKPKSGKIAVKVINHYGDEVLKVYRVG